MMDDRPSCELDEPGDGPTALAPSPHSATRSTVEFLVVLLMGILFARGFAAEAYIVPTGSMAPILLGMHREYICPNCGYRFDLGMDESGRAGRPVCPNCGEEDFEQPGVACNGDRLLVQKHLFDLRPPRRWEVAVFQNPNDPSQAYVKRVVGLPGESILIEGGDVYADGQLARKTLVEQRALRIPVFDNDFPPADSSRYPRWSFRHGDASRPQPSGWRVDGERLSFTPGAETPGQFDWLEYRHIQPERHRLGAIRDFVPYNGADLPGENRVRDLFVELRIRADDHTQALAVRLGTGADAFRVVIPAAPSESPKVYREGRPVDLVDARPGLFRPELGRPILLEASWIDRRLTVAIDGELAFEPVDCDDRPVWVPAEASPFGLALPGGAATVDRLRIYRDIYYTDALAYAPRRPFGVDEPYALGPGEYFVLGDNSPVSNDSRFWPHSPVVRADQFLGKPFLVHLPSQGIPLKVFGRELYWIPDPREIRYIR